MNWYYAKNGSQQGPVPMEDMKGRISRGELLPTDLAWCEGMADWLPISEIEQLKIAPAVAETAESADERPAQSPYVSPAAPASPVPAAAYPGQPPSQGLALGSMICGILSLVGCCVWFVSAPLALVAIVLAVVASGKIKAAPQQFGGQGMARAGMITGALGLIAAVVIGGLSIWMSTLSPEEMEEKIIKFIPEEQRQEFRDKMEEARKQQQP
ncbi:GYF domain-containing protein [Luteolibacter marinus]|uniref:GYF domain-containing protein n=1 Tax=Luteolibacter marinus TaxID=2776705 RepID=UPI001868B7D8|nr:GYF domain-containing protein [Luteolibacter marinus]